MEFDYYILLSVASFIITSIVLFAYLTKTKAASKIFVCIMLATIVTATCEVITTFFYKDLINYPVILQVLLKVRSSMCEFWVTSLVAYTISTLSDDNAINSKKWYRIIYSIFIAFFIVTIILPLELGESATGELMYMAGPNVSMIGLSAFIEGIVVVILVLRSHKAFSDKRLRPLYLGLSLFIVVYVAFQINPPLMIVPLGETLVIVYMYTIFEDPDIKLARELTIAKNSAEKSNRAKNDFLSSIGQELEAPLNVIMGLSEDNLTFKENLPSDVIENCNDIVVASNNLLGIIENLFNINMLEKEDIILNKETYDLKEEIIKLAKSFAKNAKNKNIEFSLNISKDFPDAVVADKAKLNVIIKNILSNAVKYTESGEVSLLVSHEKINDGINLKMVFKDSGRGISKEKLANIFNKFEREEKDSNISGLGLGLAITKQVVELMNGTIDVESEAGVGSTFTVVIPVSLEKEI